MLEEGISYPTKGENALGKNLLGGLLVAVWFLIIPALAYYGYLVRVLRDTVAGREEPPAWDDWGTLIGDGVKLIAISVGYGVVPFALAFGIVLLGGLLAGGAGDPVGAIGPGAGLAGLLVFLLASLILLYIFPAAVTNFAVTGRLGSAFERDRIGTVVTSSEYAIAWLLPIVIYTGVYVINLFLLVTVIGLILIPWISFYASVVTFQMFGQAYHSVLTDPEEPETIPGDGE